MSDIEARLRLLEDERAILNVLATYAWTGGPGTVHSACAKAGVLAMTRTLAVEWARHGIRVNAIAPGYFPSRMTERIWDRVQERTEQQVPLGRAGREDELKGVALFLASEASSYVTGQTLVVDGGTTLV